MIVWLASFPRSGNTLVRTVLQSVFGLKSYSKYEAKASRSPKGMADHLVSAIGAVSYDGDYPEFYASAQADPGVTVVKTHDQPEDGGQAIYVVRNGLVATDSYRHYRIQIDEQHAPWPEIVNGGTPFNNWSLHLDAWNPLERPDTLLLTYEALVREPTAAHARIAEFLDVEPVAAWVDPWASMNAARPDFFRRGQAGVPDTLTGEEIEIFMARHGEWMRRLGYAP
ncbi:sulfotransferase domain-containing protein [Caulobacter rhizosphaerae]|uniref:sulfotransferase domain-containing protein n=1 Tax=Caulobacter rhizosphaerae TaxID=2010972 RepID=UPI0027E579AE|nr:sulfotransferase domain-containing protein [Caulobacter rhizosphaerae]